MLQKLLSNRKFQRWILSLLRFWKPLLRFRSTVVLSDYASVTDALNRPNEFSVKAIYEDKMKHTSGEFYLGMDDTPQYRREREFTNLALHAMDINQYRVLTRMYAEEAFTSRKNSFKIDVVQELSWLVPLRVCDSFFGVSGPDRQTLSCWMRYIFQHLFLNLSNSVEVKDRAERLAANMDHYLKALILRRKSELAAGSLKGQDFLSSLLRLQSQRGEVLDDEGIQRNLGGVILGSVDTISKSVVNALDELLSHPQALQEAQDAARKDDIPLLSRYLFEALRFNPHNPLIVRRVASTATIRSASQKQLQVLPGDTVYAMTYAAMFDPRHIKNPNEFSASRQDRSQLQFGYGIHRCFGEQLSLMAIPEILRPLLRAKGLSRIAGAAGEITSDGPFPDHFFVRFDDFKN
jgi:cytochrome P450